MSLVKRITHLELKVRQPDLALVYVKDCETSAEALQRCYPGEKPKVIIWLDKLDLLL